MVFPSILRLSALSILLLVGVKSFASEPPFIDVNAPGSPTHMVIVGAYVCSAPIAPNLTLGDPDSASLTSATATLVGVTDPLEILRIDLTGLSLAASYISTSHTLVLSGIASVAEYRAALRKLAYYSGNPLTAAVREVSLVVSDGLLESPYASAYVKVARGSGDESFILSGRYALGLGKDLRIVGASRVRVWWGPVICNGNIDLLDLDPLSIESDWSGWKNMELNASNLFMCAGISSPPSGTPVGYGTNVEKWVRWNAAGELYSRVANRRIPVFPASYESIPITDFFSQAANADWGPGWTMTLLGEWDIPWDAGQSIYWQPDVYDKAIMGKGALTRQDPEAASMMSTVLQRDLNYWYWKSYAIEKNGYAKWSNSYNQFVNANNYKLWVTSDRRLVPANSQPFGTSAFVQLSQLSMASLIPPDRSTFNIADGVLFLDTPEGNPVGIANSGTPGATSVPGVKMEHYIRSGFFWKGLMYVNGDVFVNGTGSPTVFCQDPNQFYDNPGQANGHLVPNCFLDGVLYASGTSTGTSGTPAMYGTAVYAEGISASVPDIYYNSRNRGGMFGGYAGGTADCNTVTPVTVSSYSAE